MGEGGELLREEKQPSREGEEPSWVGGVSWGRGLLAEKLSVPWICVWISFYLGEMFVEEKLCQILACFCFLNELYCKSNLHPRIYNLFSYYIIY